MKRGAQLAIWAIVIALAGAIYVGEARRSAEINAPVVRVDNRLLPVPIEEIGAVEIMIKAATHRFERDDKGQWFYHGNHGAQAGHVHDGKHAHEAGHSHESGHSHQDGHDHKPDHKHQAGHGHQAAHTHPVAHSHRPDPKAAALIEQAMVAFGRMQRERSLPLKADQDEYGVTRPEVLIMVYRPQSTEPLAQFAVGSVATDTFSRYLLPVGSTEVVTVPDFHIKNLMSLVEAMKAMGTGKA